MESTITYETLFEILRKEKNRDELQKLEGDFYELARKYIEEKRAILRVAEETATIFSETEQKKVHLELVNIERIIREIYHRREKKIVLIALNRARTGSELIDTATILPKEHPTPGRKPVRPSSGKPAKRKRSPPCSSKPG